MMLLRMMMMEMLALLMRCLLNTFTLCHSWQKGGVVLDIWVVILRGRVSIGHFVRRSVDMRDVVRITCIFSSLSFIDTLFLYFRSCDHFFLHTLYLSSLYVDVCFFHLPHTCVVSFLSLYKCFLYLFAIYYFCFTQRCLDEFCLKCFRNIGCQSLLAINSLLAKFFKSLC